MTVSRTPQCPNKVIRIVIAIILMTWTVAGCLSLQGEEFEVIDAREILNSEENIKICLRDSLAKGNIGLARSIVSLYDSQHEQVMVRVLEDELLRLKQLQAEIVQSESTCEPVAKWGQNQTHIFLSLKLSHRWDSPPCLNTKHQTTHSSSYHLNYTNLCVVSNSKITFSFHLNFYRPVAKNTIVLANDGVGTYSTIIEKEQAEVWPFLGVDERIHPLWPEISQRHNSVHKQYQDLLNSIIRARKSKPVVFDEKKNENQTATPNNQTLEANQQKEETKIISEETEPQKRIDNDSQSVKEITLEDQTSTQSPSETIRDTSDQSIVTDG